MNSTTANQFQFCQYCGAYHNAVCPRIKTIEYYPDGTVKKVELYDFSIKTGTPIVNTDYEIAHGFGWCEVRKI